MEKSLLYRIILVVTFVVIAAVSLVPTGFYDQESNKSSLPDWWTEGFLANVLPQDNLSLGLDLQGGMDLVVSVNVEEAVLKELDYNEETLKDYFKREKIAYVTTEIDLESRQIKIEFESMEARDKADKFVNKNLAGSLVLADGERKLTSAYKIPASVVSGIRRKSVEQVRNVIVRRIDAMGLREPEVMIQGDNQIRLQLPGAKDPEGVKETIRRAAVLDFMIVDVIDGKGPAIGVAREAAEIESGGPPPASNLATWIHPTRIDPKTGESFKVECYFAETTGVAAGPVSVNRRLAIQAFKEGDPDVNRCYLLREDLSISGKYLKDARPSRDPDPLSNSSQISFTWELKAAQKFGKLTGDNIGRQLAVVLEGQVHSAPTIQAKIFDRGVITGNFSSEEALNISTVLKSGSLNVQITFEEERTVGASLGNDSIAKGKQAIFWGALVVIVFMVIYYRMAGLIADLALVLNIVFIMATLSVFGATLTLPGIAGIVLTVGMAVDANVLIFERVREELRMGKTPIAAIESGYGKALWTILDANITTLIAALVLLQWGTGPIKGFAVTLAIGIVTSMFTAIVVTRMVYDLVFHLQYGKNISIGIKLEPAPNAGRRGRG